MKVSCSEKVEAVTQVDVIFCMPNLASVLGSADLIPLITVMMRLVLIHLVILLSLLCTLLALLTKLSFLTSVFLCGRNPLYVTISEEALMDMLDVFSYAMCT